MTDQDFLTAILDDPEADAPRLIYADWLEEQGQGERANYIRVRIEWDNLPDCGHDWVLKPGGWNCDTCLRKDQLHAQWTNEDGFPPWERWLNSWEKTFPLKNVIMKRGFVEEVHCTQADWYGNECSSCNGKGSVYGSKWSTVNYTKCDSCHGTGIVTGHGPAIVRVQPVTKVALMNRQPRFMIGEWYWFSHLPGSVETGNDLLPRALIDCMERTGVEITLRRYPDEADALAALSAACLTWAKKE